MHETREINALFHLLDDPDQEVFDTVANKILMFGKEIIPNLEHLWETTVDEHIQERIEMLIHRVHYQDLQEAFRVWHAAGAQELIKGALLTARYQYPDLTEQQVHTEIDRIKRNIWLELNNYLTPLEQINVLNSMIYNYFGLKGEEVSYQRKNQFFINQVIEGRKGNPLTNGIVYQALCAMLDLPVYAVNIPGSSFLRTSIPFMTLRIRPTRVITASCSSSTPSRADLHTAGCRHLFKTRKRARKSRFLQTAKQCPDHPVPAGGDC